MTPPDMVPWHSEFQLREGCLVGHTAKETVLVPVRANSLVVYD